jgi:hypothetical protein
LVTSEPRFEPERRVSEPVEHVERGLAADEDEAARAPATERREGRRAHRGEDAVAAGRARRGRHERDRLPVANEASRRLAGGVRARGRDLERAQDAALDGVRDLAVPGGMRTAHDAQDAAEIGCGRRLLGRRRRGLAAQRAAEGAREADGAGEDERARSREQHMDGALEVGVGAGIADDHGGAARAQLLDRRRDARRVAHGSERQHRGGTPARRGEDAADARVVDRVLRVAGEGGLVHRHAVDQLAAALRRAPDLGDRRQHERLVRADGVHRRVELRAERAPQRGVDLLEDDAATRRVAAKGGADAGGRLGRRERAALRVAHRERGRRRRTAGALARPDDGDAAAPGEQLGADVARAGQVVGEDAERVQGDASVTRPAGSRARARRPARGI